MSGTTIGGQKTAAKLLSEDPDYYKKIGQRGGKALVPKGFALMTPEQRSAAGKRGGKISRRAKVST